MTEQDFMPIQNFDYIEFYVGDAKHTTYYFAHAWGFVPIAYAGLETGVRDRSSYVLEQGNIRLIITSALEPESEIAKHVHLHGDGVKDVAFRVDSAEQAYRDTRQNHPHPLAKDHIQNVPVHCSQRQPDSNFARALGRSIGHHAVYSDDREYEPQNA